MLLRLRSTCWLALIGCILTLAASGDDLCFLRVAVPSLANARVPLPLDDPNSDFVDHEESSDSAKVQGKRQGRLDLAGSPRDGNIQVAASFLTACLSFSTPSCLLPTRATPLLC
jgi:hypothetical protein